MYIQWRDWDGIFIFLKGLEQRRIQHRTGAKVNRMQALIDWSQNGQHHHSTLYMGEDLSCCRTQRLYQMVAVFVQSLSCLTLWPHGLQHNRLPCPSLSPSLLKLKSTESVMSSNHLILCRLILLMPLILPSIRVLLCIYSWGGTRTLFYCWSTVLFIF